MVFLHHWQASSNFRLEKNAALVSVCHYLEYHSRVGDRFSSSGRIRCVQFPVILFLKLGAGHSHGCILWQFNFTVQYKNQLIISLNCGILSLRFRVFHRSLILTQKTTSAKSFLGWSMWFFHGRILQQALPGSLKSMPIVGAVS